MKSHRLIVSSDSDYDQFANEIPLVGNILQTFEYQPLFTAAETQAEET